MEYICGFTFAPFCGAGVLDSASAKESLKQMQERTGADFVIFAPNGVQKNAHSEEICYTSEATMTDEELVEMIAYAKELGLRVALKPTANCADGTWRAFISFFDYDVVCEAKWSNWFPSYTAFQLHYATIAEETGCEMFIAGCEMVMTEHREKEWRKLISDIKEVYHGLVSYNTDKYQEEHVTWWDAVDVISSSGYYPIHDWENQLDRIERVVKKYQKPFFFSEAGCMSVKDSNLVPNNWEVRGDVDLQGQRDWYETMFEACGKRDWLKGMAFWSWNPKLPTREEALAMGDYEVYQKPAEQVIKEHFFRFTKAGLQDDK